MVIRQRRPLWHASVQFLGGPARSRARPTASPPHWRGDARCGNDAPAVTAAPPSDADLLAALGGGDVHGAVAFGRGDAAAFETLYERHPGFVLRVARRFCGDDDEALDVLQETFAWLCRKAPDLRLRHRLSTLLYPVAKHLAADRRKQRARGPQPAGGTADLDEPAVELPLGDDVRDWFVGLGPLQQEILALRFADDLSLDEIAATLAIPLGTAKSRLHTALTHLRTQNEGTAPGTSSSFRRAPEKPATD